MRGVNKWKHGHSGTRLHRIWTGILNRCYWAKPGNKNWHRYGGRGIVVCEEWRQNFLAFHEWSLANGYADDLSIDRIDNDGNYSPDNCRWATQATQSRNTMRNRRLTAFGETKCLRDWENDSRCQVDGTSLKERLERGWSVEDAISLPPTVAGEGPHPNEVLVTAWNETKCLGQWARDTRCRVNAGSLRRRLAEGMSAEEAMTAPRRSRPDTHMVEAWGEVKTITDWAADCRCRCEASTIYQRIKNGWTGEDAISNAPYKKPRRSAVVVTAWGESKTIFEWFKDARCHVTEEQLRVRLKSGVSAEEAISLPAWKKRRKPR